ncbi:paraquat-inducible protein A [Shewanella sp. AS16]|uniref:paraquat-inducible protein A n=1 Tax=Shewanella sp. AS16 TaxID=2907625 RepID=UPI001F1B9873|nr:paraquat-inducible protein A [Shewanella sp. AS16]MCE9686176.1 paraquat-inducible protein A [Shewanella sp. AS16]
MKSSLSISVILISLALLIPGVTQPILSISGSIEKSQLTAAGLDMLAENLGDTDNTRGMLGFVSSMLGMDRAQGEVEVFQKTRSIWGTATELHQSGNSLVAALVILFSVAVPGLKLCLMLLMHLPMRLQLQHRLARVIDLIAKWSMADVFVVALIITYMTGNASAGMGERLQTQGQFEVGFYYFTSYCLFSILSGYLLGRRMRALDK